MYVLPAGLCVATWRFGTLDRRRRPRYRAAPLMRSRKSGMPDRAWWERLFAKIDGKDVSGFLGFLTEDAEFRFANNPPAIGREAVGAVVGGFLGAIGGSRHRFIHAWEDGTSAACEGEVTYTRHDGST